MPVSAEEKKMCGRGQEGRVKYGDDRGRSKRLVEIDLYVPSRGPRLSVCDSHSGKNQKRTQTQEKRNRTTTTRHTRQKPGYGSIAWRGACIETPAYWKAEILQVARALERWRDMIGRNLFVWGGLEGKVGGGEAPSGFTASMHFWERKQIFRSTHFMKDN
jgi:hypothetical protein